LEEEQGSKDDRGVEFGLVKDAGNEVGEFCLGVGGVRRIFRTGKDVGNETGTKAGYVFVLVEWVWFLGEHISGGADDLRIRWKSGGKLGAVVNLEVGVGGRVSLGRARQLQCRCNLREIGKQGRMRRRAYRGETLERCVGPGVFINGNGMNRRRRVRRYQWYGGLE
jgi:hypothetical protein